MPPFPFSTSPGASNQMPGPAPVDSNDAEETAFGGHLPTHSTNIRSRGLLARTNSWGVYCESAWCQQVCTGLWPSLHVQSATWQDEGSCWRCKGHDGGSLKTSCQSQGVTWCRGTGLVSNFFENMRPVLSSSKARADRLVSTPVLQGTVQSRICVPRGENMDVCLQVTLVQGSAVSTAKGTQNQSVAYTVRKSSCHGCHGKIASNLEEKYSSIHAV